MMPWRPLGMLTFGVTVIFLFIRLHGNGYDFPVEVAVSKAMVDFWDLPDRTFLEVSSSLSSGVYHDRTWESVNRDHQGVGLETAEEKAGSKEPQEQKFMGGWHLGRRKNKEEVETPSSEREDDNQHQWLWMTNIWHEVSECGPGHLRQYRRRLDHLLASDNSSSKIAWELMYMHRFPGPITHSSLSKRIIQDETALTTDGHEGTGSRGQHDREVIRLAVVYKVVEDEHVSYHTRVYHFGTSQSGVDVKEECKTSSKETCHAHPPFVSYDYILPGSTPIKDFSLEHDTIIYSRLSDTAMFRTLKLPLLKPGSTSPERPHVLSTGAHGPSSTCGEKKSVPYRMSYLASVPSNSDRDEYHVMMGQVQEYHKEWRYQVSISTEATDANTKSKKWLTDKLWLLAKYDALVHENDMVNDEPHTYGVSVQKPYIVRSADGSSIHIPIKDTVVTREIRRHSEEENDEGFVHTGQDDRAVRGGGGKLQYDNTREDFVAFKKDQERIPRYPHGAGSGSLRSSKRRLGTGQHFSSNAEKLKSEEQPWDDLESWIDAGSLDTIDTDLGVINDAADVMVLKTTRNGLLILKRGGGATSTRGNDLWHLSMIMDDPRYNLGLRNRETAKNDVIAMKIILVPVPVYDEITDSVDATEADSEGTSPSSGQEQDQATQKGASKLEMHNILLVVYGSGRVSAFDLHQTQEQSSAVMFLQEKYPVVIGMLAVVVAFVINEAR